jgi:YHS domain-containing protein
MESMMRITTVDPIAGCEVSNRRTAPYVIEGEGKNALKIYFCNAENKAAYLEIESRTPTVRSITMFNQFRDDDQILWD